jgi:hypothetical protein
MMFQPKRGDRVLYGGDEYYFQPNGRECYLFAREEDIGNPSRAIHRPSKRCLSAPQTKARPKASPRNEVLIAPESIDVKGLEDTFSRLSTSLDEIELVDLTTTKDDNRGLPSVMKALRERRESSLRFSAHLIFEECTPRDMRDSHSSPSHF